MSYIGTAPTIGNFQVCDAISVVNGQASYTMLVGGVNATPQSANHMLVSLNGILQKAGSSFTVSGSTITFASNLVTGDVIDFIQILGNVLDLGVPSDATVSTAKIVDGAVTSAKLDSGVALGKVLQVVTSTSSTNISTTSQTFVTTNFSLAITPSATSSKILLMANTTAQVNGSDISLDIYRSTSSSFVSGGKSRGLIGMEPANAMMSVPIIHLDSPNTTSAITYTIYFRNNGGSTSSFLRSDVLSSFTALEIGA